MFGGLEEMARNDASFVLFSQELDESFGVAANQVREDNRASFGPDGEQILARLEEGLQNSTVRFGDLLGAQGDLREMVERDDAHQLQGIRCDAAEEIVDAPHALGQKRRGQDPAATEGGEAVGLGQAAGRDEIRAQKMGGLPGGIEASLEVNLIHKDVSADAARDVSHNSEDGIGRADAA